MDEHRTGPGNASRFSRRGFIGTGLTIGAGAVVAACGGGSPGQATEKSVKKFAKPPAKPDVLKVRSWGPPFSSGIEESAGKRFTADTGIKIKFDTSDFGQMQTKIQQALAAGRRPPVDLVLTVDRMAEQAYVAKLSTPLDLELVPNLSKLADVYKVETGDGQSKYASYYAYTFPVIYKKGAFKPTPDMSWLDLAKPEFKDTFVMASTYEVVMPPVAKALGVDIATESLDPVWAEIKKMRATACGLGQDTEFQEFVKQGQCSAGAFILGNAFELQHAGLPIDWMVPKEGSTLANDALYVPAGLPDEATYWAQKLVDYMIEPKAQTKYTAILGTIPTSTEAQLRKDLRGNPACPTTDAEIKKYAIPLDPVVAAKNNDDWQAQYIAAVQG